MPVFLQIIYKHNLKICNINIIMNILEILKIYADYHSIVLIKYIAKNEGININELITYLFK